MSNIAIEPQTYVVSTESRENQPTKKFGLEITLKKRDYYNEPLVILLRRYEIVCILFVVLQISTTIPISFIVYLIDWKLYFLFHYSAYAFIASSIIFFLIESALFTYFFLRKEKYE